MVELTLSEFADRMMEIIPVLAGEFLKRQTSELFKGEITIQQFFVLEYITHKGQSRMTDMAHYMKVSTAAMTGVIERLVRAGYVFRLSEPRDRRIIKIAVLPKGSKLVDKFNRERRQMIMDLFGKLTQKEREDYLRIVTRLRDAIEKSEKGDNGER